MAVSVRTPTANRSGEHDNEAVRRRDRRPDYAPGPLGLPRFVDKRHGVAIYTGGVSSNDRDSSAGTAAEAEEVVVVGLRADKPGAEEWPRRSARRLSRGAVLSR